MALERPPRAICLAFRINMQYEPRNLAPVDALSVCIEQPQVSHQMFLIVTRQHRGGRRHITDVGIERGPLHGRSRNRVLADHSALGTWQIDDRRAKTPLPLV
jgi:hypothetical protein